MLSDTIFIAVLISLITRYDLLSRLKSSSGDGVTDADVNVADEDEDVTQERRRVLRGSGRRDVLQIRNLSKVDCLSLMMMMIIALIKLLKITSHVVLLQK